MSSEILQEYGARALPIRDARQQRDETVPPIKSVGDIELMHDYVLIRELEPLKITSGGIALPDDMERPPVGVVEQVGPGRMSEYGVISEMHVKVGDVVYMALHPHWMPFDVDLDNGDKCRIARDRDLMFKVSGEALQLYRDQLAKSIEDATPDESTDAA